MNKNDSILMLAGSDALGRKVSPVGAFNDKQVGVFYFLWIGQHGSAAFDNSVLDIDTQKNDRSGEDVHHYWGKPMYGYYDSGDPWVFRKHLQMLTMAGVDYLVFDTTNTYFYEEVCRNIFPVALDMIADGWNIPRFVFDTNCRSSETVEGIYKAYYDPATENGKKYAPLWYRHGDFGNRNGGHKPWIIAKNNEKGDNVKYNFDALPRHIRDFFYLRESAWFEEDKVPYAFATDIDKPTVHEGMLSVSVAQHVSGAFSDSVFEKGARDSNRGRGFSVKDGRNDAARVPSGSRFDEEWQRALGDPAVENVFVTSWNEWVAQKQPFGHCGRSCCYFVDQYNTEFSRDIEPVQNELGDNYYMQMLENIRLFKSGGGTPKAAQPVTVDIRGGEKAWESATAYYAFSGDGAERNYKSANRALPDYRQCGATNDIVCVRAACDDEYLYIRAECAHDIAPQSLCEGHFVVWIADSDGRFTYKAELFYGGARAVALDGSATAQAESHIEKRAVSYKIRRSDVGLGDADGFQLKVTDGIKSAADAVECYTCGKSVPLGRLNFFVSLPEKSTTRRA